MFKIIVDSACDLPLNTIATESIETVPLHITVNGHTIDDHKDFQQVKAFYHQLLSGTTGTTSQINVGEFVHHFTSAVEAGNPILYLGFSSGMSGTFNSAVAAKKIIMADHPDAKIVLVDTLAACGGIGLMVEKACQLRAAGQSLDYVAQWIEQHRFNFKHLFTLSNLSYLVQGGRLSKSSAMMGQLLHIQPVLTINQTGKIEPLRKTRSMKKSLESMAKDAAVQIKTDQPHRLLIATSDESSDAKQLCQIIKGLIPDAQIDTVPIGMTLASHTGPNCTALFYEAATNS